MLLAALAGCASTQHPAPIREVVERTLAGRSLPGHYRVQLGDTLYKIAFERGLDYLDLAAWNHIADPGRIRTGDFLRVQPPDVESMRPGVRPTTKPVEATTVSTGEGPPQIWSWPLKGPILNRFGVGLNKGIDIAGPRGLPVHAAADGRVVYAGSSLRGYGKLIIIRHGKTLLTAYAHNARILVQEGQNVSRGQTIGEIGDSDADRVELHFEIRKFGQPVDPLNYLPT